MLPIPSIKTHAEKKAFLEQAETNNPLVDPAYRNNAITQFSLIAKHSKYDASIFEFLKQWVLFVSVYDDSNMPNRPINPIAEVKTNILRDYCKCLGQNIGNSPEISDAQLKSLAESYEKSIIEFVPTDDSTDMFRLIKRWEMATFGSWYEKKRDNIAKFVKKYKY